MINRIKRIWNDPVGSKLISALIIGIFTLFYSWGVSQFSEKSFINQFLNIWTYEIEVWLIVLIFLCTYITSNILIPKKSKAFQYDDKILQLDKTFFDRIRFELLSQEAMLLIRYHRFSSNPVKFYELDSVLKILDECDKSDFEFFHPELNSKKMKLIEAVKVFNEITSKYLFGRMEHDWLGIPSEWDLKRYHFAQNEIRESEIGLCEYYDELIRFGRKTLKV